MHSVITVLVTRILQTFVSRRHLYNAVQSSVLLCSPRNDVGIQRTHADTGIVCLSSSSQASAAWSCKHCSCLSCVAVVERTGWSSRSNPSQSRTSSFSSRPCSFFCTIKKRAMTHIYCEARITISLRLYFESQAIISVWCWACMRMQQLSKTILRQLVMIMMCRHVIMQWVAQRNARQSCSTEAVQSS